MQPEEIVSHKGDFGFPLKEQKYGFTWGPATVLRHISDPQWGVILQIKTPKETLTVRVTPSGLIRVGTATKAEVLDVVT